MSSSSQSIIQGLRWILSNTKRLVVLVLGTALVATGLAMLILPGPGILVSIVGLAVLATEFAWAERTLDRSKARAIDAANKVAASAASRIGLGVSAIGFMVVGGMAAAFSRQYRALGVGAFVAGITAAAVLLPQTRRFLNSRVEPQPAPDPVTTQPETNQPERYPS